MRHSSKIIVIHGAGMSFNNECVPKNLWRIFLFNFSTKIDR